MKLLKVIKKEYKDFIRDKGYILTILLVPLILILIFGYTFQADITNLKTIVIDNDNSNYSKIVIDSVDESDYFKIIAFSGNLSIAKSLLEKSEIRALIIIPSGFEKNLDSGIKQEISVYLDSSDYTIYNFLKGASSDVLKKSLQKIISNIVNDLESEKDDKQKKIDEIQSLVNNIDEKAKSTLKKVSNLTNESEIARILIQDTEKKIDATRQETLVMDAQVNDLISQIEKYVLSINDLNSNLNNLKLINPNLTYQINSIQLSLNSLKNDLQETKSKTQKLSPLSRIYLSKEHYNIPKFYSKLNADEALAKDIETNAYDIEETYDEIKGKIDVVYIELKTLKKDFLSDPLDIDLNYEYGEITYFQYLTPAIMSLVLFFIGVVLTTLNMISEKISKTAYRVSSTPLSKLELFIGKFFVFFVIGGIEVLYVFLIAVLFFDVTNMGSYFDAGFVLILMMGASVGIGLLISSFVKNMRQAVMLVPLVVVPSVLISQTFSPIEVMPQFMRYFAYLSPMFYSNVALREIMIKGSSLSIVLRPVLILLLYAFITLAIGILFFKKRIE